MKDSVSIMIKVIRYFVFVLVFLVISCNEEGQGDRNDSGKDSTYRDSSREENNEEQAVGINKAGKTYNERLAGHSYEKYCVVCHGIEGKGNGFNAEFLDTRPADFTDLEYMNLLSHEYLVQAISEGGQAIYKSPLMPVWGNTLTSDEVQRLATYVSNFGAESQDDNFSSRLYRKIEY
ncbi:MAG: cytochrome c [Bacteroidota bacterium]